MRLDTNGGSNWDISDYKEKYLEGILKLFKGNYPDSDLWKKDFFNWQNFQNPAGKSVIKLAINSNDEVVGFYCVVPQVYLINGKKTLGSISLNTLVRIDYRGMGIFTALAGDCFKECLSREIMFTLGFPNQNSYHGFTKKLGFVDLGEMPLLLMPRKVSNLLAYKLKLDFLKIFFRPMDWFLSLRSFCCDDALSFSGVEAKNIGKTWINLDNKSVNAAIRDQKFIKWRTGRPGKDYKIVIFKKEERVYGYIVLGYMESDSIKNGLVVDLMVDNCLPRDEVMKYLLDQSEIYWKSLGVDQIGCLIAEGSVGYSLLRKYGYIKCPDFLKPQPMRPVIKWHGDSVPGGFYDLKNWYITMIDYDVA